MKVSTRNQSIYNVEEIKVNPNSFIEIEVRSPQTYGNGFSMYTDYEIVCKTNLPMFKHQYSTTRRRYSRFECLKFKLEENDYEIKVPNLPVKVLRNRFSEKVIEERRQSLERFLQILCHHLTFIYEYDSSKANMIVRFIQGKF